VKPKSPFWPASTSVAASRERAPLCQKMTNSAFHEPCSSEREFAHFRRRSEPTHVGCYQAWFMVPMRA